VQVSRRQIGGLIAVAAVALGAGWLGARLGRDDAARDRDPAATAATPARPPAARPRVPLARGADAPRIDDAPTAAPVDVAAALADLADADAARRRRAVRDLARAPSAEATRALLDAAYDRDLNVSVMAAEALDAAYRDGHVGADVLAARYRDARLPAKTRTATAAVLLRQPSPEAVAFATELAGGADPEARRFALGMLIHQDPLAAVPLLLTGLRDADEWVRYNAAEALRTISGGLDHAQDPAAWSAWWQRDRERFVRAR
jgi:HEAT repeat protein